MLGSAKTLKSNGHPFGVVLSRKTPGAEGTALLLVGQEPTRRRSARSHPARMTRLKGITAHHAPHSECPKPCGFREAGKPGESTLGPIFTPCRTNQTGRNSGVRGTRNSITRATLHSHPHPRNLHQVQSGLHTSETGQLWVCIRHSIESVY